MIPVLAAIHVRHARGVVRLWAPLFLLWIVLIPIMLVLAFPVALVCLVVGVNPIRAGAAIGGVLFALNGTRVEVESPGASVLIRII